MAVTVEKTNEAILIKLPLNTSALDIQQILNYFEFIELASETQVRQEEIDALAKEVKSGWWQQNRSRFLDKEGFEEFTDL